LGDKLKTSKRVFVLPLEASWNKLKSPSHFSLLKPEGFVVGLKRASSDRFKSSNHYFSIPKPEGCQAKNWEGSQQKHSRFD
jgi:hypothetical protein